MTFAAMTRDVGLFAVQCKRLVILTSWIFPLPRLLMQQRTCALWKKRKNLLSRISCTCPLFIFNIFTSVAEMATYMDNVFIQTFKRFWENSAQHPRPERPLLRWCLIFSRPNWKARSMFDMMCGLYGKSMRNHAKSKSNFTSAYKIIQQHVSDAEALWSHGVRFDGAKKIEK